MAREYNAERRRNVDKKDEKPKEPIILELDDRLEFGAVVVDGDDPTGPGLDFSMCHCINSVPHCGGLP